MGGPGWPGSWGQQDEGDSVAAIADAVEVGVNWIDTAPVYGFGRAERVVGRALAAISPDKRPLIVSKCGLSWDDDSRIHRDLCPDTLRRQLGATLARLQVDVIDVYLIHFPDEAGGVAIERSWEQLAELRRSGAVRCIGVSNFGVGLLERCEQVAHVDCVEPPYSLINRRAASEQIPWAKAHDTGVICYSPLHSGMLTDEASERWPDGLGEDDWRRHADDFRPPALLRNLALRDALRPVAQKYRVGTAEVAIAWVLATLGVTGAIVGVQSRADVRRWSGLVSLELTEDDMSVIWTAITTTCAGTTGPRATVAGTH
jgi:aryl-alcohol dehydrogenase-like predicted oxidoreductase